MNVIDLFQRGVRFGTAGDVTEAPRRMDAGDSWQMASFRAATNEEVHADHWEKHPPAEELVCCLHGRLRVHLMNAPGEPDEVADLGPGQALIVPRDRWHRLELLEPSEIVSIGRRGGTQLAHQDDFAR